MAKEPGMQRSRTYRQQGAPPENKTGEIPHSYVGMPTLKDILQELEKPGRDPRGPIKIFEFDKNVRTINDLREGMELPGIVGNITNFGAFVDIGIKENGLIHLSQLADRFVSDPNEIVSIHHMSGSRC